MKITRNPNLTLADAFLGEEQISLAEGLLVGWTGKEPEACPGYLEGEGVLTSLPLPNLATCTRDEVRDYFDNTWTLTEVLFSGLRCEEALYTAPYHQLRHPLVFYYAHPAALYVNKLRVAGLITDPIDPFYETLFETGVDEMSWDDMSKNETSWPSLAEASAYRKRVYGIVLGLIDSHPGLATGHEPIGWEHPLWVLFLGFEHERIHIETSLVLIRELPSSWLERPKHWPADAPRGEPSATPPARTLEWLEVVGGEAALGKPRDYPSYGWDNEYGEDSRPVEPFAISKTLVSNGEFHAFVVAGGYRSERLWTPEGWGWRTFRNVKWPTFWVSAGPAGLNEFKLRAPFETIEMPWAWPAVVNYHEAKAYAQWLAEQDGQEQSYRLPTEAEYALLRAEKGTSDLDPVMLEDGLAFRTRGQNLNLAYGSEGPVDLDPSPGAHDLVGNVWRWCEDDFHPFPGSQVHPYYDDFSSPCYDGEHTMILGGSFSSTGDLASVFSRFHFRPHFFQHAGFHLVRDASGDESGGAVRLGGARGQADKYERTEVLAQYLELHYGTPIQAMPYKFARAATEFPRRCADLVLETANTLGIELKKALDIGCAVGRSSFELARGCPDVTGIDLSAAFVETCWHLQAEGKLDYQARAEGDLREDRQALVAEEIDRNRVTFRRADAMGLPPEFEGFCAVLIANVFCRLPSPGACLCRLGGARGLVRPGGLLVATSPYSWHPDFTPREVWLGGRVKDGVEVLGKEGLREFLDPEFEFVSEQDMPFVIRDHVRKYELVFAHASVWRRRTP
ncbi:MAG: 5-histidylcysteine sulfoxide synthase [Planctomycetes bacterium]|nr:5-histidylcysteine sulfoxide synthase [Planctomycetota bacterium]